MPQDSYPTIQLNDSTIIAYDPDLVPGGFDTLSLEAQKLYIRNAVETHIRNRETEQEASPGDIFGPFVFVLLFALVILWIAKKIRDNPRVYDTVVKMDGGPNPEFGLGWRQKNTDDQSNPEYLTCPGKALLFMPEEYATILAKYSPYYKLLTPPEKEKFITRLMQFISKKTFFIHAKEGYREMPVLTSACAIQLSFGLEKFEMPAYPHIHIYPEEFLRTNPDICFLQGSVSGYSIYLSWKHLLQGDHHSDGQHVGLHEMAHAYHCQNFEKRVDFDDGFIKNFDQFYAISQIIFDEKVKNGSKLYSVYALKNFQEFWAETIEIYFEKPHQLQKMFPELYSSVSLLLNQDHASRVALTI